MEGLTPPEATESFTKPNTELPYPGEALTKHLLEKQKSNPIEASDETRVKFEQLYQKLPEFAERITKDYFEIMKQNYRNPGEVRLYMVGGRVKDQPLKDTSDIDLVFAVETEKQGAESFLFDRYPGDASSADSERLGLKTSILQAIAKESASLKIANEFQTLSFGRSIPENPDQNKMLLIGIYRPASPVG